MICKYIGKDDVKHFGLDSNSSYEVKLQRYRGHLMAYVIINDDYTYFKGYKNIKEFRKEWCKPNNTTIRYYVIFNDKTDKKISNHYKLDNVITGILFLIIISLVVFTLLNVVFAVKVYYGL